MGIFDAFTAGSAKDAANENKNNLAALKSEGMGYLDTGLKGALGSLDAASAAYDPVKALAAKYNMGGDMLLNALGLNGASGNATATSTFQSSPGYDYAVDQSLNALDRRAASRGMLGSGNNTIDTLNTVHGIADQDYNNWLTQLSGLTQLGATQTNTGAAGTAAAETAKAPVYTNDAQNRVNLASGVTNGINSQNTQAANASMQGSSNLMNFGMNLAKLAAGAAGGFGPSTALLGGK